MMAGISPFPVVPSSPSFLCQSFAFCQHLWATNKTVYILLAFVHKGFSQVK